MSRERAHFEKRLKEVKAEASGECVGERMRNGSQNIHDYDVPASDNHDDGKNSGVCHETESES